MGSLFKTTDYGATWQQVETELDPDLGDSNGNAFLSPWSALTETLLYHGNLTSSEEGLYETNATSSTDRTPTDGTDVYGPVNGRWCLRDYPGSADIQLLIGSRNSDGAVAGFYTEDGWLTYTQIFTVTINTDAYLFGAISGDAPNIIYLWGSSARIGYSQDKGATIDDRSGNIPTDWPSGGDFVMIAGL